MNNMSRRTIMHIITRVFQILVIALACLIIPTTSAFAQEEEDKDYNWLCVTQVGCSFYDPSGGCGVEGSAGTVTPISLKEAQTNNAKIIIGVAKTYNLGQAGAVIGIMTALAESGLQNYANTGVPVSMQNPVWLALPEPRPLGKDHDSVGVFQQRPSTGWSTIETGQAALTNQAAVWQLMDVPYSAQAFFGTPPGSNAPPAISKGLQNKPGWQSMEPWVAAQSVQISAFADGRNYKAKYDEAVRIVNDLWNSATPVPLAVAINNGPAAGGPAGANPVCDTTGNINCDSADVTGGNLSNVRKQVVCIARNELALWASGQLKPGTGYHKYSQGRNENWCADFASWVYNKAGYPILPTAKDGNVPAVQTIWEIGQQNDRFKYHAAGSYVPKPGDMIIHKNGASHVNIVTAVSGNSMTIIGGNQGKNGFTISSVTEYVQQGFSGGTITGYVTPD